MSPQIVLILGAGANIGKSLVQKFSSKGFKVAIASRTLNPELLKLVDTSIKADFSSPSSIKSIFDKVKSEIGTPNVVIYNGKSLTRSLQVSNMLANATIQRPQIP
jgi:NAD(P)-dependent dehydrogenase (short-subunit alcohol dehydrogenase family)